MQVATRAGVIVTVVLLAGCTSPMDTAEPTPNATSDAVDWTGKRAEFLAALGPPPNRLAFTEEEAHAALAQRSELEWAQILTRFPAAVRPTTGFTEWQTKEPWLDEGQGQLGCLTEHGLAVDIGRDRDGNPGGIMLSLDDEASTVAAYFCQWVAFPTRPSPQFTASEFGYQYDYLVGFVTPCLEAHGVDVPPPISREAYITEWPNQGWFPSIPDVDEETHDELLATCSPTMPDRNDPAF